MELKAKQVNDMAGLKVFLTIALCNTHYNTIARWVVLAICMALCVMFIPMLETLALMWLWVIAINVSVALKAAIYPPN